ncbi:methylenetetrahydrofolate--tRNA-(uracil(54)-C(5))-methyltransferase (FADH(2)-oxidizing) TrmFO [soil metagenome]
MNPNPTALLREIHVVGAGLAGSECALQLADVLGPRGYKIVLHEMRGTETTTPAHKTSDLAELVCSNSFGSLAAHAASGLLKWEAEHLGSKILSAALESRVPAGQALGMDREIFAKKMTEKVSNHPSIEIRRERIDSLDQVPRPTVIATGPLTHDALARSMQSHFASVIARTSGTAIPLKDGEAAVVDSEFLYFFDAIAPIIAADSINTKIAWKADRWDKGTKDYWNCPMSKAQYLAFINEIRLAKKIESKEFEKVGPGGEAFEETPYFESCMPIEAMLERGPMTLRFGPMSGKGLIDPADGRQPYAAIQLRQDNKEGTAFNIVGFQTKMAYADQVRVFRTIPGLEDAEFLKLGSIHRNLYINTPKLLNRDLSSKIDPWLFFAGQITGVEGYFESTCVGLLVARLLAAKIDGLYALDASDLDLAVTADGENLMPPRLTALGSLHAAITDETKIGFFQPTNVNFSHLPEPPGFETAQYNDEGSRIHNARVDKKGKKNAQVARAKEALRAWLTHTPSFAAVRENSLVEAAATELAQQTSSVSTPAPSPHSTPTEAPAKPADQPLS